MDLGNGVEINFGKLTDEQLNAARAELNEAGEARGLWVPEGAGSLVVAETVDVASLGDHLLASVEEGANLFNGAIEAINGSRKKAQRIPVVAAGEYRERAEDWLTDSRLTTAGLLPVSEQRPLLLVPRLNRAVTTEEIVDSWKSAANGNLYSWSGRMEFLNNWTADQLSGFDPSLEDEVPLIILPTAYDQAREGNVRQQTDGLEIYQESYPQLDVATIFDGAVLARRYLSASRRWQDSYVRGINLAPAKVDGYDCVPSAYVDDGGSAFVSDSYVDVDYAARLRVR